MPAFDMPLYADTLSPDALSLMLMPPIVATMFADTTLLRPPR